MPKHKGSAAGFLLIALGWFHERRSGINCNGYVCNLYWGQHFMQCHYAIFPISLRVDQLNAFRQGPANLFVFLHAVLHLLRHMRPRCYPSAFVIQPWYRTTHNCHIWASSVATNQVESNQNQTHSIGLLSLLLVHNFVTRWYTFVNDLRFLRRLLCWRLHTISVLRLGFGLILLWDLSQTQSLSMSC